MHILISSVVEIFHLSGNSTARSIADKLERLPDHAFATQFASLPHLKHLRDAPNISDAHPLAGIIKTMADHLPWQALNPENATSEIVNGSCFCHIVGPESLIRDDTFRMGFYLQASDLYYTSHSHNAEEVYFVLSGTALWRKDNAPFALQSPGTLIHHLPNQPHTMHTQKEPLLALWAWVGDIGFESYTFH